MATQDELLRVDETQFRLLEWTQGQAPSERLVAQVLDAEGYKDIDPSHPLGGKDGGRDGHCTKHGEPWTWAVYFPRGQQSLSDIESKLADDIDAARKHNPKGVAFVTNQELRLAERAQLRSLGGDIKIDLFHLERVATILDRPRMAPVRQQYLRIAAGPAPMMIKAEVIGVARRFVRSDDLLDIVIRNHEKSVRDREAKLREQERERGPQSFMNPALLDSLIGQRPPGSPPRRTTAWSDDEIEENLSRFNDEMKQRWDQCTEYLASVAWPALHFRITNEAKAFLKKVEVILTFHQAKGLRYIDPSKFEWMKLEDPSRRPLPAGPFGTAYVPVDIPRLAGYPVQWRNIGDDLVVTINLPELRPGTTPQRVCTDCLSRRRLRGSGAAASGVRVIAPDARSEMVSQSYLGSAACRASSSARISSRSSSTNSVGSSGLRNAA